MLFLDRVYFKHPDGSGQFRWTKASAGNDRWWPVPGITSADLHDRFLISGITS
jgi:hypothetical protein